MNDIHERILEYRIRHEIRQSNRKWVAWQIFKVEVFIICLIVVFVSFLK